ncbi:sigma-70 family RNA polymerase sigma factor [Blautia schinkii]|nr:sigma-70 family RNA polymerase sigma factor [Blautia schinkii]
MTNEQLVIRIKAGIDVAENMLQLWQQNRGFIAKIAMKYRAYEDIEDLKQEGYFGLCHAVDGYNPDEGVPFINYAAFWIRQSIQRYMENYCSVVRIPTHVRTKVGKYKRFCMEFEKYYGRKPSDWEICNCLGIDEDVLASIKNSTQMAQIGSLDSPVKGVEDGELTVGDTVADGQDMEEDILDKIQKQQLKETLWSLVDTLPGQQGQVLRLRYQDNLTLKETGERLGCDHNRARTEQSNALRELRKPSRVRQLQPLWYGDVYNRAVKGCGVGRFNETWTSSTEYVALELACK